MKQEVKKFGVRSIATTSIHADNKFEKLWELLIPIYFEISARDEHVEDIEREMGTLKEQYQ